VSACTLLGMVSSTGSGGGGEGHGGVGRIDDSSSFGELACWDLEASDCKFECGQRFDTFLLGNSRMVLLIIY